MRACVLVVMIAASCSRPRDRDERVTPALPIPPRDARTADAAPETPAWITEAMKQGGPGLCASWIEGLDVYRRAADGRLVERLAFTAKHAPEPDDRTEFRYDRAGRPTQRISKGTTDHTFDETVDVFYDKAGHVVRRREKHTVDPVFYTGDVNTTYAWKGKALPGVVGKFLPLDVEDPTQPLAYALAFTGTVHEARFYDGSPAPQPQNEYLHTYDARGRLVHIKSIGWSDTFRDDTLTWDADDQLVAYRTGTSTTEYVWRDHHVVATRHLDQAGVEQDRFEWRFDAQGRPTEIVRIVPRGTTRERVTSSVVDRERGELVTTTVQEDVPPATTMETFRYDCGPPATPK